MSQLAGLDGCPEFRPCTDVRTEDLSATLDLLAAGVVVVADRGRILHANAAARRMLSAREPIAAVNGILWVHDPRANRELTNAIARVHAAGATIPANGIGVALRSREPAVAHVLPLAPGKACGQSPEPKAAVFVTQATGLRRQEIAAVAESFGLTPAEARTLEQLLRGATITDTAAALGVSIATAKTHLIHIFAKTGVSRQPDLIALVHRLLPPIEGARTPVDQSKSRRPPSLAHSPSIQPRSGAGSWIPEKIMLHQ